MEKDFNKEKDPFRWLLSGIDNFNGNATTKRESHAFSFCPYK